MARRRRRFGEVRLKGRQGKSAINAPGGTHAAHRIGDRCGPHGYGRTPTRAVESALSALVKSHALRKGGR